ncbi:DNA translocase FtsK [Sinobaca qinghaiensis]|uniref:DNA translocase FtsK n=1 Tax=Sinobaca qinghaiensis TaxID=342944 RepID=A0A419V5R0_9BACL|nr:DNA translocase FtsK [Sinobaca qinghaiensis]RKD75324.1 DNA translocase FtsK [Sinobaca qinghaiensis]
MAKTRKRTKKWSKKRKSEMKIEWTGLVLLTLALTALFQFGLVGELLVSFLRFFAGDFHIVLNLAVMAVAAAFIFKKKWPRINKRIGAGVLLGALSVLIFSHISFMNRAGNGESSLAVTWNAFTEQASGAANASIGGGMTGALLYTGTYTLFGVPGSYLIAVLLAVVALMIITGVTIQDLANGTKTKAGPAVKKTQAVLSEKYQASKEQREQKKQAREAEPTPKPAKKKQAPKAKEPEYEQQELVEQEPETPLIYNFAENAYEKQEEPEKPAAAPAKEKAAEKPAETGGDAEVIEEAVLASSAEEENKNYILPSLDLLNAPERNTQHVEKRMLSSNARKLEETLLSFGVKAKVNEVHLGPAVTKYEVQPDTGVKVSRIVNLTDDLALALAARDIRIEAPIPGKSAVGIEIPNQEVAMVTVREVLETGMKKDNHPLAVALGRDISGEPVLAALNKMPHLLVAGATGSGKSVCINGIITSILMKARPHEVKLMMIDPKMVELNVYNGIPHLLAPVVTEPKRAAQALKKVVAEMERRYDLFSHTGTRNMEGYNQYVKKENEKNTEKQLELPYIVVIVDELADLMMVASSDVEDAITRLAQMARAAGIHMIIATQRPSVNVITGVIKANIPSRIAFGVTSQIDSRTILDSGGAEKLLGKGDMLFSPVGSNKSTRIQGAFISDGEVEAIVASVIAQQKANYQEEMIPDDKVEQVEEIDDSLYDEAVAFVVERQSASVSMLQRKFRVGYTRAARLIDAMEERGIVGPYGGSKPRDVISAPPAAEEEAPRY